MPWATRARAWKSRVGWSTWTSSQARMTSLKAGSARTPPHQPRRVSTCSRPSQNCGRHAHFLVVAVDRGNRLAVDVGQGLGVAEVVGDADGQIEGGALRRPLGRHGETGAQGKFEARAAPHAVDRDALPGRNHPARDQPAAGTAARILAESAIQAGRCGGGRPAARPGRCAERFFRRSNGGNGTWGFL